MKQQDNDSKVCASCFFTDNFPGVTLDESGRCNYCNSDGFRSNHSKLTHSDLKQLRSIADQLKAKTTGKYDCIIGASGGLDSSYVIYVAKKILGLNPLVVNYDHDFTKNIARENLNTICKALDIDLIVVKSKKKYDTKFVRSMTRAMKDVGAFWGCCSCCKYILPVIVCKYALEKNISTWLCSSNVYEDRATGYLTKKWKSRFMLRNLFKLGFIGFPKAVFHLIAAQYYFVRFKMECYAPPLIKTVFNRTTLCALLQSPTSRIVNKLNAINITNYVHWDINKLAQTLEEELGWKSPEKPELPMRFDCELEDAFIDCTYKKATGLTFHAIVCNNLIFDGVRTKSELADAVKKYEQGVDRANEKLLKNLKIT